MSGASSYSVPAHFPKLPDFWTCEPEHLKSADGSLMLFINHFHTQDLFPIVQGKAVRVILLLHGFWEHSGRYAHVPFYLEKYLPGKFQSLVALDHRGHGKSEGVRGHVEDFDDFIKDAAQAVEWIKNKFSASVSASGSSNVEIHLLGHSMGGLVALRLSLLHPEIGFKSIVLSAPALGIKVQAPVVKKLAAQVLTHFWGSLQMDAEFDPTLLSKDPSVAKTYAADRLVHTKITPRFFMEFNKKILETRNLTQTRQVPALFLIPSLDGVIDPETTREYFSRYQNPNKELLELENLKHEIFNEVEKEQVFEKLCGFWRKAIA
jgi:alpha-beta hydrolase superfamily lysophospholipase